MNYFNVNLIDSSINVKRIFDNEFKVQNKKEEKINLIFFFNPFYEIIYIHLLIPDNHYSILLFSHSFKEFKKTTN